jgi:hypothetical protein
MKSTIEDFADPYDALYITWPTNGSVSNNEKNLRSLTPSSILQ